MHHVHEGLGAVFIEQHGWLMPEKYKSAETEIESLRNSVGVSDLSFIGKLNIQGRNIDKLLSSTFSDMSPVRSGEAVRARTVESKTICLVCNLSRDEIMILTRPRDAYRAEQDLVDQVKKFAGCAHLTNVTSSHAGTCLAGPLSSQVLMKMTDVDVTLKKFPNMSCAQGGVAKVPTIILRNDLGSLPAFELYFGRDLGEYMWDAIVEEGQEFGVTPFGLSAREKQDHGEF